MADVKILELLDSYYPVVDGAISVVKNYSKEINKIAECDLAVPKSAGSEHYTDNEEFVVYRCKSSAAPENYRLGHPDLDGKFIKIIKERNFDIFHAHSPFAMGKFAIKMGKKLKVPVILTLHTQYHQDFMRVTKSKVLTALLVKMIMQVYNQADSVWTVSEASKRILRQYGFKGNIEVVRNGTDYTYPDNPEELINLVNEKHNLKGQKNVFVFVGRMAMYKNLKLLCDAIKILKQKGKDFKMLFVGGGFDYEELVEYIHYLGIDDVCITTDEIRNRRLLQGYYLRSDLLVFPSTFDMASIVKVEAAAHKCAGVLIKDSCSAELVVDGDNGFLCEENAQSLADKLIELCDKPEVMKKAGERAYRTLYRSWQMVAEEVLEKYKKVIDEYSRKQEEKKRLKEMKAAAKKNKTSVTDKNKSKKENAEYKAKTKNSEKKKKPVKKV